LLSQKKQLTNIAENLKTRRWGRGRQNYTNRTVSNKFGELSPLFFYPLIQGFAESKQNEVLWGGENGGRLLSGLLVTLSTFVESAGNHPGTSTLASDLFEISWSFCQAQNPEVRRSVLISLATCLPYVTADYLARMICTEQLPNHLEQMKQFDSHEDCRQLASLILESFISLTGIATI
jgi:hypothetical protein